MTRSSSARRVASGFVIRTLFHKADTPLSRLQSDQATAVSLPCSKCIGGCMSAMLNIVALLHL